jgi:hypothetical protein
MGRKRWTGVLAHSLSLLADFSLWDSMMFRVYHGGKPEARHQLVEATDETTISETNWDACSLVGISNI